MHPKIKTRPWTAAQPPTITSSGPRQLCRLEFGSSGTPAKLAWQALGRNDFGVVVRLPPECGILEITASGDFAGGALIVAMSEDDRDYHPVVAPIRGPSSQRLNVRPGFIRPRVEGGTYGTAVIVSLVARC